MPELSSAFSQKALVCFVTAGDPSLEDLPAVLDALQDGGADIIEVGIPFSDPIADGPVIQASSQRALDRGVTPGAVLEALSRCEVRVPVVLMGYYNPVLRMGLDTFALRAREAGASGTILSDLTPEESGDWLAASRAAGLDTVFLAAPTSTDARLDEVCRRSTGFVYAVSRTGVTGATQAGQDARGLVARLKARTDVPICVGFGISTVQQVREVWSYADGAVVGSYLVDLIAREWDSGQGAARVRDAVAALKGGKRLPLHDLSGRG